MRQCAPSHDSVNVCVVPSAICVVPTAMQRVFDTHATDRSQPVCAVDALARIDQRDPSQRSIKGVTRSSVLCDPTAMHPDEDQHATRESVAFEPGLGVAMTDHFAPSQRSASVDSTYELDVAEPTAVHDDADVHATPVRKLSCGPRFGLGCACHDAPFHISTKVRSLVDPDEKPTATQCDADVHATEDAFPCDELGDNRHALPSHTSASAVAPTATQRVALQHATPCSWRAVLRAGVGATTHGPVPAARPTAAAGSATMPSATRHATAPQTLPPLHVPDPMHASMPRHGRRVPCASANSGATQESSLAAYKSKIAGGAVKHAASGGFGGFSSQRDSAYLQIDFTNVAGQIVATTGHIARAAVKRVRRPSSHGRCREPHQVSLKREHHELTATAHTGSCRCIAPSHRGRCRCPRHYPGTGWSAAASTR